MDRDPAFPPARSLSAAAAPGGAPAQVTLVLGGARSGKSDYAQSLIEAAGAGVYLATAEPRDAEMAERIRRHRARRGAGWRTVEEPLALTETLAAEAGPGRMVLVDCLTLWLSNLMQAGRDVARETEELAGTLPRLEGPAVIISNEVGLGIVPDNAAARAFRDHAGRLHQAVAAKAQRVIFMTAGIPMVVKDAAGASAA